jgi:hypothetical protein
MILGMQIQRASAQGAGGVPRCLWSVHIQGSIKDVILPAFGTPWNGSAHAFQILGSRIVSVFDLKFDEFGAESGARLAIQAAFCVRSR